MSIWDICPMCGSENNIKVEDYWLCYECDFKFQKGRVYYSKVDDPEKWD